MRVQRQSLSVFSLSFLDIISCAFGAIVMLVLLAKNGDEAKHQDVADMSGLLRNIAQVEDDIEKLNSDLSTVNAALSETEAQT